MTYILAATEQTALKLAQAIAPGRVPPMADTLEAAEALRQLHPRPLAYGLAIWEAKIENGRLDPVSVDLVRSSELAQLTAIAGPICGYCLARHAPGKPHNQLFRP